MCVPDLSPGGAHPGGEDVDEGLGVRFAVGPHRDPQVSPQSLEVIAVE
jgi:hypothetical protein